MSDPTPKPDPSSPAWPQAELAGYLKDGRMKSRQDLVQGLEDFPEAWLLLFNGENFGKLVLRVAA